MASKNKNTKATAIYTSKNRRGLLWAMPVGTESSPEPTEELPAIAESLGSISDGGVTLGEDNSGGDTISDSDGDVQRNLAGSTTRTLTFTLWQTRTKAAMSRVYYEGDITADADGNITGIDATDNKPTDVKLVMEYQTDQGQIGRRTYHICTFQSRGEEVVNAQNIVGREVVYNIERDNETNTFWQDRNADVAAAPASAQRVAESESTSTK